MDKIGINQLFWKDKKVLITGHTGFKGTWLSAWLDFLGAKVSGISIDPKTNPNMYDQIKNKIDHQDFRIDLRNNEDVKNTIKKIEPEIVIHLAAQPLVRYSYKHPIETYQTNIMGSIYLLEAVRFIDSVKVVLIITSDKCYLNKEINYGYSEEDAMGGFDPYSSSKGCTELIASSYFNSFLKHKNVCLATARAGNVIGGGDWAEDRLIPDFVRAKENHSTINIRYPNSIRPWQHVVEPLSGYLMLCENLWDNNSFSGAWNFGPEGESVQSVKQITSEIMKYWNIEVEYSPQEGLPHEASLLKLNIEKAKTQLGWNPKWEWRKAIKKSIEWYEQFSEKRDLYKVTISQIESYLSN